MAATMLSMQTSRLAARQALSSKPNAAGAPVVSAPRAGVVARAEKQNLWYPGAFFMSRPWPLGRGESKTEAHNGRARGWGIDQNLSFRSTSDASPRKLERAPSIQLLPASLASTWKRALLDP